MLGVVDGSVELNPPQLMSSEDHPYAVRMYGILTIACLNLVPLGLARVPPHCHV